MSIGSLVVEVSANVARFTNDLDKMRSVAESQLERINGFVEKTKGAFIALGAGAAVGLGFSELKSKIDEVIESSAGLVNLAARTGSTVEGLSALTTVAKVTGVSTDQLATGLTKLDKSISALNAGTPATVAAFGALGLSAKDFVGLSADEAFKKVADSLAKYQDGVEKTAAAQLIFGKAGAALIPLLRDTADAGDLVSKVTAKQAEQAEQYEKTLRRLQIATEDVFRTVGLELVPVFNAFAKAMLESATSANGLNGTVKSLAGDGTLRSWAETAAKGVAFVVDAFDGVARVVQIAGNGIAALFAATAALYYRHVGEAKDILKAFAADADAILSKSTFSDRLAKQIEASHNASAEPAKQKLDLGNVSGKHVGTDKAELDNALKITDAFIKSENALLAQREAALTRLYQVDKLSISDYFNEKTKLEQDNLAVTLASYDKEIAAVQKYIDTAKDEKTAIEGKTRLAEIQAKAQDAVNKVAAEAVKNADDAAKAQQAYADKVEGLNIKLLTLQGRLGDAARLQAELTFRQQEAQAVANHNAAAIDDIAKLKANDELQGQINDKLREASVIEGNLANTIARVNLAQQAGQIGELQALAQTDAARRAAADQLEKIATDYQRLAQAATDPRVAAAAEAFKLKIDQLAASTNEFGKKFADIGQNAFANTFASFIDGTKSAKQAFDDFVGSIFKSLAQLAAQDIAKRIFGSLTASGTSGGSSGGGGFFSALLSAFGGGKADGGSVSAGSAYIVGENGPEILTGASGRIIPNGSLGGHTININMPAGTQITRDSANLLGATVARHLAAAHARGN